MMEARPQELLVGIVFLNFNSALGSPRQAVGLEGRAGPGQRQTVGPYRLTYRRPEVGP